MHYRQLSTELSALPIEATCADLVECLKASLACDGTAKAKLIAAVADLAPAANWLDGLIVLCAVLGRDNARFMPGLFMEWATEEI